MRRGSLWQARARRPPSLDIRGSTALVTGANRGLGRAFTEALLQAGAAKVYAGARDPAAVADPRLTPIRLDVMSDRDVAAAACGDATLLVNNAGILLNSPILADGAEAALRDEMEVNVFGLLRMARAFAPVLAGNGGGAMVNMLSVASWFTSPFNATYCASKHAALAVSDALRIQLRGQGTHVVGVHAGFIETDMAAHVQGPRTAPPRLPGVPWTASVPAWTMSWPTTAPMASAARCRPTRPAWRVRCNFGGNQRTA